MSYSEKDSSVSKGAPIECYKFVASHKSWYLTSYSKPVTVAGFLFTPTPITRTALEIGSIIDTPVTMDFSVPSDHELAKTFCYSISPKELEVTVYRVHEGDNFATDYKVEYVGEMAGAKKGADNWATISTASKLQTRLNSFLSTVYYQRTCNHVLFDERCKVNRADFTKNGTVLLVQSQLITINSTGYADSDLVGGVMTNARTGEQQGIISNVGQLVRVGFPFFDLIIGDTVEMTQGCDHQRLGHCKNRYNNVPNYGGFDHVPEKNPFEQLNYDSTTNVATRVRTEQEEKLTFPSPPSGRAV